MSQKKLVVCDLNCGVTHVVDPAVAGSDSPQNGWTHFYGGAVPIAGAAPKYFDGADICPKCSERVLQKPGLLIEVLQQRAHTLGKRHG